MVLRPRHFLLEENVEKRQFKAIMSGRITSSSFRLCLFLLAALVSFAAGSSEGISEPADSKVHVIEYEGFWRFLDRNPLILMEFYAPWW
jgi:hypothetical protein